jgi:hypothetical protein
VRERVCVFICEGQREIVVLPSFSNYARVNLGAMKQKEKCLVGLCVRAHKLTRLNTYDHSKTRDNISELKKEKRKEKAY